jgi:hypothetical protein
MLLKKPGLLLLLALFILSCKKEPFVPNSANALPGLWKQLETFPGVGRVRAFGFTIGNKGYILGGNAASGFNLRLLNDFWEYDPATDKWTRKADYPGQAAEYIRGFSINNKAYVGTGFGQRCLYLATIHRKTMIFMNMTRQPINGPERLILPV